MEWISEDIKKAIPSKENGYEINPEPWLEWFPELKQLADVPQDPVYHAEGDVLTHTNMVLECLSMDPDWRTLPPEPRTELWIAALLHDIGKMTTTITEPDGRITSPGHSRAGAQMARYIIYTHPELTIPMENRERIVNMIRYHGLPVWLLHKEHPKHAAIMASQLVNMHQLYLLAKNDMKGRISDDHSLADQVELFPLFCEEHNCLHQPFPFPDEYTRFVYSRDPGRDPSYPVFDDTVCEVIMMSGLPGAGKDTWITEHGNGLPVVSLDELRKEFGISPEDNQGTIIQTAKERAREYLRKQQSFIWNATNLTEQIRQPLIDLFTNYKAKVRIQYIEVPYDELLRRNRDRPESERLPEKVIEKMVRKVEGIMQFSIQYHYK